jgi:hypothetical protein
MPNFDTTPQSVGWSFGVIVKLFTSNLIYRFYFLVYSYHFQRVFPLQLESNHLYMSTNHTHSLHFGLSRQILSRKDFVEKELVPFFRNCHPQTIKWISNSSPHVQRFLSSNGATSVLTSPLRSVVATASRDIENLIRCW